MKRNKAGSAESTGAASPGAGAGAAKMRSNRAERESLVLWRKPVKTLGYFLKELRIKLGSLLSSIGKYKELLAGIAVMLLFAAMVISSQERSRRLLLEGGAKLWWAFYWMGLGVLSSIGLGTGLHTFILYLGPHIASVTHAAYECGCLNFPSPPYPEDIVCPPELDPQWTVSVWNIMRKVSVEAIMWGAGTALGELPPYFMARAARLSTRGEEEEEDLVEYRELHRKEEERPESLNLVDRTKLLVERLVAKVGFFGILVCASIPNPLFDLAGITCGHFLVPFWTFFGATLIGKALVKMSIQCIFVIVAFSDSLVSHLTVWLSSVPKVGSTLQSLLDDLLRMQRDKLHGGSSPGGAHEHSSRNPLASVFDLFVMLMVAYFVVSIVNSFAQNYHKRIHESSTDKKRNKD